MDEIRKDILEWINQFNEKIDNNSDCCGGSEFFLKENSRGSYISLESIVQNYVKWMSDLYGESELVSAGLYGKFARVERLELPSLWNMLNNSEYIQFDQKAFLNVGDFVPNSVKAEFFSNKIVGFLSKNIEAEYNSFGMGRCAMINVDGLIICEFDCFISQIHNLDEFNIWIQKTSEEPIVLNYLKDYHVSVLYSGDDNSLNEIPRVIEMKGIWYEEINPYPEIPKYGKEVFYDTPRYWKNVKIRVSIDDKGFINLKPSDSELREKLPSI